MKKDPDHNMVVAVLVARVLPADLAATLRNQ
jgi:hypothetical protein